MIVGAFIGCFLSYFRAARRPAASTERMVSRSSSYFVLTEQQVHNAHNQDHGHHSADAEGDLAGDEAADLIDNQGDHIGEHAHIADGKGGPLGVVHLPLDGAHGRETGAHSRLKIIKE